LKPETRDPAYPVIFVGAENSDKYIESKIENHIVYYSTKYKLQTIQRGIKINDKL
jgi:hypothetical protein